MNWWTIQIIAICITIITLFGTAAYLAFTATTGWIWFLLAALAISAGFDFSESDCDVADDGIEKGNDSCRVHNFNGDNDNG